MCLYGSVNRTVCFFFCCSKHRKPIPKMSSFLRHSPMILLSFMMQSSNFSLPTLSFFKAISTVLPPPIPHPSSLFTSVDGRMVNHECRLCQPVKRADLRHYMICIMYSFLTLYSYIYNKVSCTLFRRKAVRGSRYGDDTMLVDASPPVLSQEKGAFCNYFHGVCEISLHFFRCNR